MKRPVLFITFAFSVGIILSGLVAVPLGLLLALGALFVISAIIFSRNNLISHLGLYLALLFFGWAYYINACAVPPDHISGFISGQPKNVFIKGVITDDPLDEMNSYDQNKTVFLIRVKAVSEGEVWKRASGYIRAVAYSVPGQLNFGDEIIVAGDISVPTSLKNPGGFDYSKYLKLRGICCVFKVDPPGSVRVLKPDNGFSIRSIAYRFRHKARNLIDSGFSKRHAGFLKSIILGDRAELETGINEDFIKTGTVHVLAISGLNVAFVAAISLFILGILGIHRKANLILTLLFLVFYAFATGANPPIIRAVVMFAVFAIGYILNRDADPINTLALAAFLMLLYNPRELFDPSFQLSFASVGSIMVFAPAMMKALHLNRKKSMSLLRRCGLYVLGGAAVSAAAWIGSSPLTAAYFNIISPISLIANLAIVPALSILTALSFIFLAAQSISTPLGCALAYVITLIDEAVFFINHIMASMPFSYFRVPAPSVYFCAAFYMSALSVFLPKKKYLVAAVLIIFNIAAWSAVLPGGKDMKIVFLDVGQGDSAYIKTPSGRHILIDGAGGREGESFDLGKSVIAPYLWNNGVFRIDALVVTHFHEDHIGGLIYILDNFKVGCVIDNGAAARDSQLFNRYLNVIKDKHIRRLVVRRGDVIGPIDGVNFYVLNPPQNIDIADSNDNSLVLRLSYRKFNVLFCGDITQRAMEEIEGCGYSLNSDVVKVPHHGGELGDAGKIEHFFEQVSAKSAVVSVGRCNRYAAPSKNTIDAILSSGAKVYQTKESGAVTVFIDKNGNEKVVI